MGKKGNLSISSENIFPIIKKWVYSDHDIFVRELISNGCDAITKLKKLDIMGEYQLPDKYKAAIKIIVNPEEIDDQASFKMAREIKEKIEAEMQYPGTIKITVVRETRAQEEAK